MDELNNSQEAQNAAKLLLSLIGNEVFPGAFGNNPFMNNPGLIQNYGSSSVAENLLSSIHDKQATMRSNAISAADSAQMIDSVANMMIAARGLYGSAITQEEEANIRQQAATLAPFLPGIGNIMSAMGVDQATIDTAINSLYGSKGSVRQLYGSSIAALRPFVGSSRSIDMAATLAAGHYGAYYDPAALRGVNASDMASALTLLSEGGAFSKATFRQGSGVGISRMGERIRRAATLGVRGSDMDDLVESTWDEDAIRMAGAIYAADARDRGDMEEIEYGFTSDEIKAFTMEDIIDEKIEEIKKTTGADLFIDKRQSDVAKARESMDQQFAEKIAEAQERKDDAAIAKLKAHKEALGELLEEFYSYSDTKDVDGSTKTLQQIVMSREERTNTQGEYIVSREVEALTQKFTELQVRKSEATQITDTKERLKAMQEIKEEEAEFKASVQADAAKRAAYKVLDSTNVMDQAVDISKAGEAIRNGFALNGEKITQAQALAATKAIAGGSLSGIDTESLSKGIAKAMIQFNKAGMGPSSLIESMASMHDIARRAHLSADAATKIGLTIAGSAAYGKQAGMTDEENKKFMDKQMNAVAREANSTRGRALNAIYGIMTSESPEVVAQLYEGMSEEEKAILDKVRWNKKLEDKEYSQIGRIGKKALGNVYKTAEGKPDTRAVQHALMNAPSQNANQGGMVALQQQGYVVERSLRRVRPYMQRVWDAFKGDFKGEVSKEDITQSAITFAKKYTEIDQLLGKQSATRSDYNALIESLIESATMSGDTATVTILQNARAADKDNGFSHMASALRQVSEALKRSHLTDKEFVATMDVRDKAFKDSMLANAISNIQDILATKGTDEVQKGWAAAVQSLGGKTGAKAVVNAFAGFKGISNMYNMDDSDIELYSRWLILNEKLGGTHGYYDAFGTELSLTEEEAASAAELMLIREQLTSVPEDEQETTLIGVTSPTTGKEMTAKEGLELLSKAQNLSYSVLGRLNVPYSYDVLMAQNPRAQKFLDMEDSIAAKVTEKAKKTEKDVLLGSPKKRKEQIQKQIDELTLKADTIRTTIPDAAREITTVTVGGQEVEMYKPIEGPQLTPEVAASIAEYNKANIDLSNLRGQLGSGATKYESLIPSSKGEERLRTVEEKGLSEEEAYWLTDMGEAEEMAASATLNRTGSRLAALDTTWYGTKSGLRMALDRKDLPMKEVSTPDGHTVEVVDTSKIPAKYNTSSMLKAIKEYNEVMVEHTDAWYRHGEAFHKRKAAKNKAEKIRDAARALDEELTERLANGYYKDTSSGLMKVSAEKQDVKTGDTAQYVRLAKTRELAETMDNLTKGKTSAGISTNVVTQEGYERLLKFIEENKDSDRKSIQKAVDAAKMAVEEYRHQADINAGYNVRHAATMQQLDKNDVQAMLYMDPKLFPSANAPSVNVQRNPELAAFVAKNYTTWQRLFHNRNYAIGSDISRNQEDLFASKVNELNAIKEAYIKVQNEGDKFEELNLVDKASESFYDKIEAPSPAATKEEIEEYNRKVADQKEKAYLKANYGATLKSFGLTNIKQLRRYYKEYLETFFDVDANGQWVPKSDLAILAGTEQGQTAYQALTNEIVDDINKGKPQTEIDKKIADAEGYERALAFLRIFHPERLGKAVPRAVTQLETDTRTELDTLKRDVLSVTDPTFSHITDLDERKKAVEDYEQKVGKMAETERMLNEIVRASIVQKDAYGVQTQTLTARKEHLTDKSEELKAEYIAWGEDKLTRLADAIAKETDPVKKDSLQKEYDSLKGRIERDKAIPAENLDFPSTRIIKKQIDKLEATMPAKTVMSEIDTSTMVALDEMPKIETGDEYGVFASNDNNSPVDINAVPTDFSGSLLPDNTSFTSNPDTNMLVSNNAGVGYNDINVVEFPVEDIDRTAMAKNMDRMASNIEQLTQLVLENA